MVRQRQTERISVVALLQRLQEIVRPRALAAIRKIDVAIVFFDSIDKLVRLHRVYFAASHIRPVRVVVVVEEQECA